MQYLLSYLIVCILVVLQLRIYALYDRKKVIRWILTASILLEAGPVLFGWATSPDRTIHPTSKFIPLAPLFCVRYTQRIHSTLLKLSLDDSWTELYPPWIQLQLCPRIAQVLCVRASDRRHGPSPVHVRIIHISEEKRWSWETVYPHAHRSRIRFILRQASRILFLTDFWALTASATTACFQCPLYPLCYGVSFCIILRRTWSHHWLVLVLSPTSQSLHTTSANTVDLWSCAYAVPTIDDLDHSSLLHLHQPDFPRLATRIRHW